MLLYKQIGFALKKLYNTLYQRISKYLPCILVFISMQIVPVSIKSQPNGNDTITAQPGSNVRKSIYPQEQKKKSGFNLWAWGDHYRDLYDMPVSTKSISLNSLYGGLTVSNQLPQLHALILSDKQDNSYILRPLGGSSSFLDSKFFQSVYKKEDFKDTYLGEFITEAYTIIHPYMFLVSESLAESAKLGNSGSHVYYIGECTRSDTIADGTPIKDKLVSIAKLPAVNKGKVTNSMDTLLSKKHQDNLQFSVLAP